MEVSSADMGVVGAVTCGVSCAGTHERIKADNNNVCVNVRTCELHGVGDRLARRVVGTWVCMEMGKYGCV